VWNELPSHHTRTAVEATEKFADGLLSVNQLARLRSTDLLESCESLWLGHDDSRYDEHRIGLGCWECPWCYRDTGECGYWCEYAEAKNDGILAGVEAAVRRPDWITVQAAFRAREIVAWAAAPWDRDAATRAEAVAQFDLFHEIVGPPVNPHWPEWRTETVRLVARGIYRDRTFWHLPILADALQDAGCDDNNVLSHCREVKDHVRGCWVVDLAMGVS
jgi:hypothetical protein